MPPTDTHPLLDLLAPFRPSTKAAEAVVRLVEQTLPSVASESEELTTQRGTGSDKRSVAGGALHVFVTGPGGERLSLPPEWERAVIRMLREALAGRHVEVRATLGEEISTSELADLLGVSRPTAANLVDSGAIPPSTLTPGNHRRVRIADVEAYLRRRRRQREAITELVADGQEAGLPDGPPPGTDVTADEGED